MNKFITIFFAVVAIFTNSSAYADVPVNITQGPEKMSVIYADKPLESNFHTIFVIVHYNATRMCGQTQCSQVMRCELIQAIRKDLADYGIPPKRIITRLPSECKKK